jgi:hypothetical protein
LDITKEKFTAMLYLQEVDEIENNYLQWKAPDMTKYKNIKVELLCHSPYKALAHVYVFKFIYISIIIIETDSLSVHSNLNPTSSPSAEHGNFDVELSTIVCQ